MSRYSSSSSVYSDPNPAEVAEDLRSLTALDARYKKKDDKEKAEFAHFANKLMREAFPESRQKLFYRNSKFLIGKLKEVAADDDEEEVQSGARFNKEPINTDLDFNFGDNTGRGDDEDSPNPNPSHSGAATGSGQSPSPRGESPNKRRREQVATEPEQPHVATETEQQDVATEPEQPHVATDAEQPQDAPAEQQSRYNLRARPPHARGKIMSQISKVIGKIKKRGGASSSARLPPTPPRPAVARTSPAPRSSPVLRSPAPAAAAEAEAPGSSSTPAARRNLRSTTAQKQKKGVDGETASSSSDEEGSRAEGSRRRAGRIAPAEDSRRNAETNRLKSLLESIGKEFLVSLGAVGCLLRHMPNSTSPITIDRLIKETLDFIESNLLFVISPNDASVLQLGVNDNGLRRVLAIVPGDLEVVRTNGSEIYLRSSNAAFQSTLEG